jgi:hypothetical protein
MREFYAQLLKADINRMLRIICQALTILITLGCIFDAEIRFNICVSN